MMTKTPGSMLEIETIMLDGRLQKVFKNVPWVRPSVACLVVLFLIRGS